MKYRGIMLCAVLASSAISYAGDEETVSLTARAKKVAARGRRATYSADRYGSPLSMSSQWVPAEQRKKRARVVLLVGVASIVVGGVVVKTALNPCTPAEMQASWNQCGGAKNCVYLLSKNQSDIEEEFNAAVAQTRAIESVYPQSDLAGHAVARCRKSFRDSYADPRDLEEQAIRDYCDAKRDLPAGVPVYLSDEEFTRAASNCFVQDGADGVYHYVEKPGFFSRLFFGSESDDQLPELVQE